MKKVILSFVIVSLTTLGVNAQVNFGIKAGVNISSLTGDDATDTKSLVGPYGGAFVNIPVSTTFSVQPELLYSMEGAKESGTDAKLILGYINIPVMLKYTSPAGFFGELGPQVGILSSAKAKEDGEETEDIKDFFKSTNFSLGIGAGFNFTPNIGVGLRYNLGLSNIFEESGTDLKTSNFAIGVHYSFGGGSAAKE